MRRPVKNRKQPGPDEVFNSQQVAKFINSVMVRGQKATARKVVYSAFDEIKKRNKGETEPIEVFETAIRNVSPSMEIRSRRIGGANYQVPREVRPERKQALAFRWIIGAARKNKGKPMHMKLADEILAAAKNEGTAIKKREDVHKMAEANRAFAHFTW
jgi:small subunit ribosomal protein S7